MSFRWSESQILNSFGPLQNNNVAQLRRRVLKGRSPHGVARPGKPGRIQEFLTELPDVPFSGPKKMGPIFGPKTEHFLVRKKIPPTVKEQFFRYGFWSFWDLKVGPQKFKKTHMVPLFFSGWSALAEAPKPLLLFFRTVRARRESDA